MEMASTERGARMQEEVAEENRVPYFAAAACLLLFSAHL